MKSPEKIANPFLRLLGFLVDAILIVTLFSLFVFSVSQKNSIEGILDSTLQCVILLLLIPTATLFLNAFLISKMGGTIGKILTGTKIVDASGKFLSFWRALFRNSIGYTVSGGFFWLGFIWTLADRQRQAWHDQIVGSFVVVRNKFLWILGIIAVVSLVFLNGYLLFSSIGSFVSKEKLYRVIYEDVKVEVEKAFETETQENVVPEDIKEKLENAELERA